MVHFTFLLINLGNCGASAELEIRSKCSQAVPTESRRHTRTCTLHRWFEIAEETTRISSNDGVCGDVLRYDRAGTDDCVFTDGHVGQYCGAGTYRGTSADARSFDFPVGFGLQLAVRSCARVRVVDEHNTVADKHVVFNINAFADKRVARDLTIAADRGVLLNFDKCTDLRVSPNGTAVEIDEFRQFDIFTETYISTDTNELVVFGNHLYSTV